MLFELPTVATVASQIALLTQNRASDKDPSIPRLQGLKNPPLSFAQQRLWFLDQMEPGNIAYNEPAAYHLFGPLDVAALENGFSEIIRRHESLRTFFYNRAISVRFSRSRTMPLPFRVIDLKDVPGIGTRNRMFFEGD